MSGATDRNHLAIAQQWVLTFAARHDAYNAWMPGPEGHWYARREPLTGEVLLRALAERLPLGGYMTAPDGTSHIAALDFDREEGRAMAFNVARVMDAAGAAAYIEPSRRGAHLWWPLAEPCPARQNPGGMASLPQGGGLPDQRPQGRTAPGR